MARIVPLIAVLVLLVLVAPAATVSAAPADPPGTTARQAELDPPGLEDEAGDEGEDVPDADAGDEDPAGDEDADAEPGTGEDEDAGDDADEDAGGSGPAARGLKGAARRTARTRDAVMRSLRRRGLRAMVTSFTAPGRGRLTVTVSSGGRRLMQASRTVRGGTVAVRLVPTAIGAKAARSRKHPTVVVTVRFQPRGERAETSTGRVRI